MKDPARQDEIALCSSCTTEDLPIPEEPETSSRAAVPELTTWSKAAKQSLALPITAKV